MTSDDVWKSEVPRTDGLYWLKPVSGGRHFLAERMETGAWHSQKEHLGFDVYVERHYLFGPRIPSPEELASQSAEIARLRGREDDGLPITEEWLRSVGFVDEERYHLSLHGSKAYGEDIANFRLTVVDIENFPDSTWEFWIRSCDLGEEGAFLPVEPQARGDVRKLCDSLGIKLGEGM